MKSDDFGAARAHLYIVGVYDAGAVESAARKAFGDWAAGPAATVKPPTPKSARSVALLDRPDAVQSTIMLGLPTPNPTASDYTALEVSDAILGGTFGSRITTNIREQKGYTYSPYSYIGTHRHYPRHLFALGYGGNGMTFGFLAAQIIARHVRGNALPADALFRFNRG